MTSNLFQSDEIPSYPLHQILRKRENRGTVIFKPLSEFVGYLEVGLIRELVPYSIL